MKRNSFLCIFILLVALTLVVAGCSKGGAKEIPVPTNLAIENDVFRWDAVVGALTYDVLLDEEVYSVEEPLFVLPIRDYLDHTVTVRANTYDGTGAYASPLTYARHEATATLPQLPTPYGISMTGNRLLWNAVLNNDGYKIFFDGKTFVTNKNATYYDLEFTRDGTFYVTMQTVGDGVTYASSKVSSSYAVTVRDGKAPLQKLPQPELSFNPESKKIEWVNRYTAATVSYEIYRDAQSLPVAVIPADATKSKLSYAPVLNGSFVSYTMRLISNNGLYSASDFSKEMVFPIVDEVPNELALSPREDLGGYYFSWSERLFADGYSVEIDGVSYPLRTDCLMAVPSSLGAGRHVLRVKTAGRSVYYGDSGYSAGLVFYTEAQGKVKTLLDAPVLVSVSLSEEGELSVFSAAFDKADSYRYFFSFGDREISFLSQKDTLILTRSMVDGREASEAEQSDLAAVFAALSDGVRVSATALSDSALYEASLRSEELFLSSDEEKTGLRPPQGFQYDAQGFAWTAQTEETEYQLMIDGEILAATERLSLSSGEHIVRIRTVGENALWSRELLIRLPMDLAPPTGLSVTGGVLSFKGSENAGFYLLYCDGELIATLRSNEQNLLLSNFIQTDGTYVLTIEAASTNENYRTSPSSEEYLYVKTDGAYGTEVKPHRPATASELIATMKAHPGDYYSLVSMGVYDFTGYDFTGNAFSFGGTLIGNGATLKGISLTSSFFTALEDATLRNLAIEIAANNFDFSRRGVLAESMKNVDISEVTLSVRGEVSPRNEVALGLLAYTAEDSRISDFTLRLDLAIHGIYSGRIGGIANRFTGRLERITMEGYLLAEGSDLRYGGIALEGEVSLVNLISSLDLSLNGTSAVIAAGIMLNGTLNAKTVTLSGNRELKAPILSYYGAAISGATLEDVAIGGTVTATESRTMTLYGVGESEMLSMKNVHVSATMTGSATETLRAAGLLRELSESCLATDILFDGRLSLSAAEMTAAGIAITARGSRELRASGVIRLSSGTARVAGGVLYAESLTLVNESKIELDRVSEVQAFGAASEVTGLLTLSGSAAISATACGEVVYSGATAGDGHIRLQGYRVTGSLEGTFISIAGVSASAGQIAFDALNLTTDLTIQGDAFEAAGVLLGADALTLPAESSMNIRISAEGVGDLCGFAQNLADNPLAGVSLAGSLSLKGEGGIYGAAKRAGTVTNIASSLSLSSEGAVDVYGLFGNVSAMSSLAYRNASIAMRTDQATYYGVAEQVGNGVLTGVTIDALTFEASPLTSDESELFLYGLTGVAEDLRDCEIRNVSYTIGGYSRLTFGGAANNVKTNFLDNTLVYALASTAAHAEIAGIAEHGGGRVGRSFVGTAGSALDLDLTGEIRFGGLYLDPENLSVDQSSVCLDLTLDLPSGSENEIGGFLPYLQSGTILTGSDASVRMKAARVGAGMAKIGGVAAENRGRISGVKIDIDVTDGVAADRIGGVAAEMTAGDLTDVAVLGTVRAEGSVGGIAGVAVSGTSDGIFSAVAISSVSGNAGGLFASANGTMIRNAYSLSRMLGAGAGFFREGHGVSLDYCYFAGSATQYILAGNAENCTTNALYLDASLAGIDGVPIVGEGSLPYETASLGYGYTASDLGARFFTDGRRYPYVASIGYLVENATVTTRTLDPIELTEDTDLYRILPRTVDLETPTVTWIDDGGCLSIDRGVATLTDNGSGTLYGVLAGGVRAYRVNYTSSGYLPFAGEGTEENPYLIADIKHFRYLAEYAEEHPAAYFRLTMTEADGAVFSSLFTEEKPFRAHLDFGGARLISPVIGEDGILGYLDGATVTGLTLAAGNYGGVLLARSAKNAVIRNVVWEGAVTGECTLIAKAEECRIEGVTCRLDVASALSFAVIGEMTGGEIRDLSLSAALNTAEDASLFLIGRSVGADIQRVQALCRIEMSGELRAALTEEDIASSYRTCAFYVESIVESPSDRKIAGLARSASGSTYRDVAIILFASDVTLYPLIKEGNATYDNVKVLYPGAALAVEGVTFPTVTEATAAFESIPGFTAGDLATPIGYDLFGEDADGTFSLSEESAELTESTEVMRLVVLSGGKPFSTFVSYSFAGDCAALEGASLHPTAVGSGTLTFTNLYGYTADLAITVSAFDGFPQGSGTAEDPYLITDFELFKKMCSEDNGNYYYRLTGDLSGEIEEPMNFGGSLEGSGATITVNLIADTLFEECTGNILGVNFLLRKSDITAAGTRGLFADLASGMTITDAAITIETDSVQAEEDAVFGLLFGRMESGARLENFTLAVGNAEVQAGDGAVIGVLAGRADSSFLSDVTISGEITLSGAGEVVFGAIGEFNAPNETYLTVDEETGVENESYYAENLTIQISLTVTGIESLTAGGLAGRSNVSIHGLGGSVSLMLTGERVTAGGAIGEYNATLSLLDLTASMEATLSSGSVGGVAGELNGNIEGGRIIAELSASAEGVLSVGGAAGSGYGNLTDLKISAEIIAHSDGAEDAVADLKEGEETYPILLAAGGAAGSLHGIAERVSVTVTSLSATSDYAESDLYLLAGGLAGFLNGASNVEVKGSGTLFASGGNAVVSGGVALLQDNISFALISGVTLSAPTTGGAVGILSVKDESESDHLFVILTLPASAGSLTAVLTAGSSLADSAYLAGEAVSGGGTDRLTNVTKLNSAAAFKDATLYADFDAEIWLITGEEIPSLR